MVTAMPEHASYPQVIPYLLYADAGAAMDWLIKTFAFTERVRDKRSDGTVRHGELLLDGGGVIMLGSPGSGFRGPRELGEVTQVLCVTVADVPAHRDRAQAAGANASDISIRAGQARTYTRRRSRRPPLVLRRAVLGPSRSLEVPVAEGVRRAAIGIGRVDREHASVVRGPVPPGRTSRDRDGVAGRRYDGLAV